MAKHEQKNINDVLTYYFQAFYNLLNTKFVFVFNVNANVMYYLFMQIIRYVIFFLYL